MLAFTALEALNVEICAMSGAGKGHATTLNSMARYDRIIARRADEVRKAIADVRAFRKGSGSPYADGIEAALNRAIANPRPFHFQTYDEIEAEMKNPHGFRFLPAFAPATFHCVDCGKACPIPFEGCGTGYARVGDNDSEMICYPCAGIREERDLLSNGKGYLYLSMTDKPAFQPPKRGQTGFIYGDSRLTNWPGTLSIPIGTVKVGNHNIAGRRYDVWFQWKGQCWHGVQIGDNTQICRVRRVKAWQKAA